MSGKASALDRGRRSTDVMFGTVAAAAARSFSWTEELQNVTGDDIARGTVVIVLADGTIEPSSLVNEPRPTGVALDTIRDGDTGQVRFGGPVRLVLVTAAVTAGQYGQTSTTPGQAQVTAGPATAFCMFTSSGSTPRAFLWGGRGGGGIAVGLDTISSGGADVTPPQTMPLPPWVKPSGSGVITADPQGRLTVDSGSTYKAFPGMTFLEGRLHLVYRDGSAHNSSGGVLKYRTSDNLGRSWSSATTIVTPAGALDVRDPNICALSSGRLLVTYDLRDYAPTPDTITAHAIYSDTRGQSWSSPYTIPDTFSGQAIVSAPAIELPDGTVLLPGFGDNGGNYLAVCWFSTDGGLTFDTQTTIASGSHDWEEPVVRYLANGTLVALIRDSAGSVTYRVASTDLGQTWGSPSSVLTAGGRPDFVEFYPDCLLLFCRSDNATNFDPRWAVSWDAGATWTSLQEIDTGVTTDLEYSAPVVLAPGYVAVVYSLENSSSDADLYLRYYFDGFGTDPLGQARLSGLFLNGIEFDDTDPDDGEVWTYDSGSGTYILAPVSASVSAADLVALGVVGPILIADDHSSPLVFADLIQTESGDDLVYADLGA